MNFSASSIVELPIMICDARRTQNTEPCSHWQLLVAEASNNLIYSGSDECWQTKCWNGESNHSQNSTVLDYWRRLATKFLHVIKIQMEITNTIQTNKEVHQTIHFSFLDSILIKNDNTFSFQKQYFRLFSQTFKCFQFNEWNKTNQTFAVNCFNIFTSEGFE